MAESAVPILPSRNLDETLEFYSRLGFELRGAPIEKYRYLIIGRGSIELHFWDAPEVDPLITDASCYIRVDDADALHREWEGVGIQSDPARPVIKRNPNSPGEDWVEYEAGNVTLAVMTPHTHDYEFTPLPVGTVALRVPDVADAKAKLEAAGVQVNEMWDSGVCHGAGFCDPAGNPILLHHRYAPYGPR